ncbi:MAG: hypothetical protein ACYC6N_18520 [Pirellulaceae bacterium]
MAKPAYFKLDSDLWPEPGPLKLDWPTRKLAIYLREAASHDSDNVALRHEQRIAEDLGMTAYQVRKSLDRLMCWPSRRRSFIQHRHLKEGIIVLRPITARWVKAYRAVWDSSLPDRYKDVLFFVWSQFAGKVPHSDGESNTMENLGTSAGDSDPMEKRGSAALFRCSLFGRQQPSILRCCYVGRRNKMRKHMVSDMVSRMVQAGLLVVRNMATSRSAMLCEEPSKETIRALQNRSCVQNDATRNPAGNPAEKHEEPSKPSRGTQRKNLRNPAEKHEEPTFSKPVSKPKSKTQPQNPIFKTPLGSAACSGWGAASQLKQEKVDKQTPSVIRLTRNECHRLPVEDESLSLGTGKDELLEVPFPCKLSAAAVEEEIEGIWKYLKKESHRLLIRKVEASTISLLESKRDPRLLAQELSAFLNALPADVDHRDIVEALESSEFETLRERSWGLLLSANFKIRFAQAIKHGRAKRQQLLMQNRETLKRLRLKLRSENPTDRLEALRVLPLYEKSNLFRRASKMIAEDPDLRVVEESINSVHRHHRDFPQKDCRLVVEACRTRLSAETDPGLQDELQDLVAILECA